ncbi:hypothetical protein D030_2004A, partial [Vibrio parahaemolyticus AQ3810]
MRQLRTSHFPRVAFHTT